MLRMIKKNICEIDSATQLISVLDVYTACNKKKALLVAFLPIDNRARNMLHRNTVFLFDKLQILYGIFIFDLAVIVIVEFDF